MTVLSPELNTDFGSFCSMVTVLELPLLLDVYTALKVALEAASTDADRRRPHPSHVVVSPRSVLSPAGYRGYRRATVVAALASASRCSSTVRRPVPMVLIDRWVAPASRQRSTWSASLSPTDTRRALPMVDGSRPASVAAASTMARA